MMDAFLFMVFGKMSTSKSVGGNLILKKPLAITIVK
jgi:hypothetical protein